MNRPLGILGWGNRNADIHTDGPVNVVSKTNAVHRGQMWWIGYISSSGVRYAWNKCVHIGILICVNLVSVDYMQTVSCDGCGAVLYRSIWTKRSMKSMLLYGEMRI